MLAKIIYDIWSFRDTLLVHCSWVIRLSGKSLCEENDLKWNTKYKFQIVYFIEKRTNVIIPFCY